MTTEFTCGIYTAQYCNPNWIITTKEHTIAFMDSEGERIKIDKPSTLTRINLQRLSALMGYVSRQYKQLQTT